MKTNLQATCECSQSENSHVTGWTSDEFPVSRLKKISFKINRRRSDRRAAHAHYVDELHVSTEVHQLPAAAASVGTS